MGVTLPRLPPPLHTNTTASGLRTTDRPAVTHTPPSWVWVSDLTPLSQEPHTAKGEAAG